MKKKQKSYAKQLPSWMNIEIKIPELKLPKWSEKVLLIGIALLIIIINFRSLKGAYIIYAYNDELGYWTHAANLAGMNWRGEVIGSWYSFGYSFILAPLLRIFSDNYKMVYQSAVFLNILMTAAIYFVYVLILKKIFPEIKNHFIYIASGVSALYSSYQFHIGITWPETLLTLLYAVIVYTVILAAEKPSLVNTSVLGVLTIYIYMVHNRNIGIIAAAIFIMTVMLLLKKVKLRHIAAFSCPVIIGIIINQLLKDWLLVFWGGNPGNNNIDGAFELIKFIITDPSGMKEFLSLSASQSFALFAGTFCLVLLALWFIFRTLTGYLKEIKSKKPDSRFIALLFMFCSFAVLLFISSVFMMNYTRADHILYTRYVDTTVGILIACAFCFLLKTDRKDLCFTLFIPVILYIGVERAEAVSGNLEEFSALVFGMPGLTQWVEKYNEDFPRYFMEAVAASFGVIAAAAAVKKKNIGMYISMALCGVMFVSNAEAGRNSILYSRSTYNEERLLFERLDDMPEKPIYIYPTEYFEQIARFTLQDDTVTKIDDISEVTGDAYVIVPPSEICSLARYKIIGSTEECFIISTDTFSEKGEWINISALALYSEKPPLKFIDTYVYPCEFNRNKIIENNVYNEKIYKLYFDIPAGSHTFEISFTAIKAENTENIGYVLCRNNNGEVLLGREDITSESLDSEGNYTVTFDIENKKTIDDMEIAVYVYSETEAKISVESIKYRRN